MTDTFKTCKDCRWCYMDAQLWDWVCHRPRGKTTYQNPLDGSFNMIGRDTRCRIERGVYGTEAKPEDCGPEGKHWEAQD